MIKNKTNLTLISIDYLDSKLHPKKEAKTATPKISSSNLMADLDITPDEEKLNKEFEKVMGMDRFK